MSDKSEIKKMPEGMSSEELDQLTTGEEPEKVEDEDLTQEALDATGDDNSSSAEETGQAESAETEESTESEKSDEKSDDDVDPKDAVIGDFRRKFRDQEIENAKLQARLEERTAMQTQTATAEPEKSPLELAEAAYKEENGDLEGFAMDGELYRKQRAFDDAQAAATAATTSTTQVNNTAMQAENELQETDFSAEKMGKGLDLRTVASIGKQYLTNGDKVDLADIMNSRGEKAALREVYKMSLRRIAEAGNEDTKLITNAIKVHNGKKSQAKPNKKKLDIDALTTEGEDTNKGEAESKPVTHSQRLADFITN